MTDQAQINAMADVLKKLETGVGQQAQSIVTESVNNPDLGFAVEAQRTDDGVTVSRYDIKTEKKQVSEGLTKNFYHIYDNRKCEFIQQDLGMFETAMGIVKHRLYSKASTQKIERLIDADTHYVSAMIEAYSYKKRLKQLNENSVQHDVASAKYTNAIEKVKHAKVRILNCL